MQKRRCFARRWRSIYNISPKLPQDVILHGDEAIEFIVPLSIHQSVEESLEGVENCHDVPADDNHSNRKVEPHRPHENRVDDVGQPTNVENYIQ